MWTILDSGERETTKRAAAANETRHTYLLYVVVYTYTQASTYLVCESALQLRPGCVCRLHTVFLPNYHGMYQVWFKRGMWHIKKTSNKPNLLLLIYLSTRGIM